MRSNKNRLLSFLLIICLMINMMAVMVVSVSAATLPEGGRAFTTADNLALVKDLDAQPKTYEALFYAPSDVKRTGVFFGNFYDTNTPCLNFEIHNNGQPDVYIIDADGNKMNEKFDADVRTDSWVHLVITHEVTSGGATFNCYINGTLADTVTSTNSFELDMAALQDAYAFRLGGDSRSGNAQNFKGKIKNVALYSDVLTADEIKASYESGVDTEDAALMAYYQLDNTDGATYIADAAGNGYDLGVKSAAGGRSFDGDDDLALAKDFEVQPKTYEAMVYAPSNVARTGTIFGNFYSDSSACLNFEIHSNGYPALYIVDSNGNKMNTKFEKVDARTDDWVHLVITHEVTADGATFNCYINGVLADTITSDLSFEQNMAAVQFTHPLSLGRDSRDGNAQYFKGRIKNVALYSDVLTADEIKASYESGVDTENTGLMAYYKLDNTDGAITVQDATGNGYDLCSRFAPNKNPISPDEYDYSLAVVGDIQKIVYNDVYEGTNFIDNTFDWIVANKDTKKIGFVMGLGDITDKNGSDKTPNDGINQTNLEWNLAVKQHQKLTDAGLSYSVIQGNHDTVAKLDQFFAGNENFAGADIGYYSENSLGNYYMRFTAGEEKYMVVCLQYGPTDEMVEWAGQVIADNPDRKVIITTHAYMAKTATTMDFFYTGNTIPRKPTDKNYNKNNGNRIWTELASQYENVVLVLSGHVPCADIKMRQDQGVHGNTVTQFLIDPQGIDLNLDYQTGLVAMFYFSNDGKDVQVEYISTYHSVKNGEDYLYDQNDNKFSFTIPATTEPVAVECEYGTIPGYYANKVTYPFVVFKSDKTFVGGYGELSQAIAAVKAAGDESDYVILMRKDAELRDATVDLAEFAATLTLDLGGNTLIKGNDGSVFTLKADNDAAQGGKFVTQNGTILKYGANPIVSVDYGTNLANDYKTSFEFSEVTFVDKNGGAYNILGSLESGYATGDTCVSPSAVFNNCTFDYASSSSNVPMINLANSDGGDRTVWDVTVNGGKIVASKAISYNDFARTDSTEGRADSLLFGKDTNGKYLVLELPADVAAPGALSVWPSGDDSMTFVGSEGIYELQPVDGYVTKYGIVPKGNEDKKILLFVNGVFSKGYDDYITSDSKGGALYAAKTKIDGNNDGEIGSTVQLLFQSDVEAKYHYADHGQNQGTIIMDLNGHTLTQAYNTQPMFFTRMKDYNGNGIGPATLNICNGELVLQTHLLICGATSYSDGAADEVKIFNVNLDNVNISYKSGSTVTDFLAKYSDHASVTSGREIDYNVNFTDCQFDLTNATSMTTLFNANDSDITAGNSVLKVNVNGCEIVTGNPAVTLYEEHATNGSTVTFNKNEDEAYLKMTVNGSTEAPTATANGGELEFHKTAETEGSITYQLSAKGLTTKYGFVPAEYAEKKILVFQNGSFLDGFDKLYTSKAEALYKAKCALDGNNDGEVGSTVQLLFQADAELSSYGISCNVGQIQGTMVFDLNGHKLTQTFSDDPFLFTRAHDWKGNEEGTIEICNGDVVLKTPLLYLGVYNTAKTYHLNFSNVNFSFSEGATATAFLGQYKDTDAASGISGKKINYDVNFTDCTIDLTNAASMATVFNAADDDITKGNSIVKVDVHGCEIITAKPNTTLYEEHATNGSFVTFNKNGDGKYLTLTTSDVNTIPSATANDGALEFAPVAKDDSSATYRLASVVSIAVTTAPTKTTYHQDRDALDVTGGKITVTYEGGLTKIIDLSADMVSGFDNTKAGTQALNVTVSGKTAALTVTVEGHTAGELVVDTAATCSAKGVGHKDCATCGKLLESNVEIAVDPNAHKWDDKYTVDIPASCGAEGYESIHCSLCTATKEGRAIAATGDHTYTVEVAGTRVDATCMATGTVTMKCIGCVATEVKTLAIDKDNHTGNNHIENAKDATCTELGYTGDTVCECGETVMEGTEIPKKGHNEENVAGKEPTCTETGLTEGKKCSVCGVTTVAQTVVDELGHTEENVAGKEPTCTETGLTEGKKCSVCGVTTVEQSEISAKGHGETEIRDAKAPTCTEEGYTGDTYCTVCNAKIADGESMPKLEHVAGDWVVTKPATATAKGEKVKKCVCGEILETAEIPATGKPAYQVFTDVAKNAWYHNAVTYVYNAELFSGLTSTEFGPDENMTRGMFVTVLGRLHGVSVSKNVKTVFSDVAKGKFYTGYVKWANENNIVSGLTTTTFGPDENVSREQICAMMVRYCNFANITLEKKNAAITFKDAAKISKYARSAVKACQQGGLVNGEKSGDGYIFRPQGNATRAEVATIMMNFAKAYK